MNREQIKREEVTNQYCSSNHQQPEGTRIYDY